MAKKTEFLYLSEPDMIKAGVLDSKRCIDVLDEMFQLLGKGDYVMGGPHHNEHGIKISFPKESPFPNMPLDGPDRRFMSMVAYLGGRFNVCGEKWYGSNIINPKRGLPRSILTIMLNDPDTCEPLALMSANLVSAVRTGSVPGVGTRYLARKNSEVCTVIGAGPINKACFQAIFSEASNLKKLVVYDIFNETAQKFVAWAKEELGIDGEVASSIEEAVRVGDIISVAASRLRPVEIADEWLQRGSTILLTGASSIEDAYWLNTKIVFDNPLMHAAYMQDAHETPNALEAYNGMMGGIIYRLVDEGKLPPLEQHLSLGGIASGVQTGRTNDDERIALMTGGMPVEDVAWGFEIYSRAKQMGIGQSLKLWDEAHWI